MASYAIRAQERSDDLPASHLQLIVGIRSTQRGWLTFSIKLNAAEDEAVGKRTGDIAGLDDSSNDTVTMTKLDADYKALGEVARCNF